MKTTVSTPTRTISQNTTLLRAFLDRFVASRRRTYPIIQLGTDSFSLGNFALVGCIQPKEVLIENKGRYLLGSKSQFNLFKKEF